MRQGQNNDNQTFSFCLAYLASEARAAGISSTLINLLLTRAWKYPFDIPEGSKTEHRTATMSIAAFYFCTIKILHALLDWTAGGMKWKEAI
jgi:hypothetical protein